MEYILAALLLHKLGKEITEDSIKKVIIATGASFNEIKAKALVAALEGVNIDEALKQAAAQQVVPQVSPAQSTGAAQEHKKEEKKEERKEVDAAAGLGALFG